MSIRRKRAFTTVEMMIACVCIGLLVVAIAAFAKYATNTKVRMAVRENDILSEYSDIMFLKSRTYDQITQEYDSLHHGAYLQTVECMAIGDTVTKTSYLTQYRSEDQRIMWFSEDESICTVDEYGRITAVGNGITRIKSVVCDVDGSKIAETEYVQYFPFRITDSEDSGVWYAYNGNYYTYWFKSGERLQYLEGSTS